MARRRRYDWVALDCGSAGVRVAREGCTVVDRHGDARHGDAVRRGLVRDPQLLGEELQRLVGGRVAAAAVSVPVHASHDDIAAVHAAVAEALGVREVWPVPAAVACTAGLDAPPATVVVDIGAQLLEVSLVEAGAVVELGVLDWGVDDLVRDVGRVLAERDGVVVDESEVRRALVGSVGSGRDSRSGAVRVVRVDRSHVEEAAAGSLRWADSQVALMRRGAAPVVAVGGGMRLPALRLAALDWIGRVRMPADPRLANVRGLAHLLAPV